MTTEDNNKVRIATVVMLLIISISEMLNFFGHIFINFLLITVVHYSQDTDNTNVFYVEDE